ncbi:hypothetical protein QP794_29630 [Paenibacillus sp. UMB7766-LJ446]|uniref:hypothetical protein n=1 Tax=Paenibacillus TaxID=44249 RepID=UPI0003F9B946|nr:MULTISPECIES: hypothetical protein [Paenibacillus]OPG97087.1 hypothetical protein B2I21_18750 [Chryseobacterium mucoviscidosis]KGP79221.1 hypothetical protein P364_0125175 [Paenibacillus sp. MAEPY2]KGP84012.1 hypothetical protein P363_0124330 [Paenibacillus sp. MAEPY1]MDK8194244.1 hypothetical protein [Paenibacillus sp. UMB7766-LJ446]MDN8593297.1 hypothetical protein [Paenibacillus sp. 11B]
MHAEVQNLFVRIHLLYLAQNQDLTVSDALPLLEERGYRVGEREIKQELEHLTQENFLTAHGDQWSLTGTGIEEFKEITAVLGRVSEELLATGKKTSTA